MNDLSAKQQQILEYMKAEVREKGYPPSVREICEAVGLKSTSTVHGHLARLEKKGYIRRDPTKPRAIEILDEAPHNPDLPTRELVQVPIVGNITAGTPILADPDMVERIAQGDMVRGITIAANGFFGPQGRRLRLPLADPGQNRKVENFVWKGLHITNFEMESSALAGLSALMGHRATTVCMVIANRLAHEANTGYKNSIDTLIETVLDRI